VECHADGKGRGIKIGVFVLEWVMRKYHTPLEVLYQLGIIAERKPCSGSFLLDAIEQLHEKSPFDVVVKNPPFSNERHDA